MATLFFDTCSIMLKYVSKSKSAYVRRLIANKSNTTYISEMTMLEFSSALASICRTEHKDVKFFEKHFSQFLRDIAAGKLIVEEFNKDDFLRAGELIKYAGVPSPAVPNGKALKTGDALIATTCQELAYKINAKVKFYTSDQKFFKCLKSIGSFSSALDIIYVDPS